ncbi:MAG: peptidoglycan-binding domain-containing protein [Rhodospirillales bacterium]|nr:peptidoglycan-binding domain-containing protein [Rhodospirillales bacterium]HJO74530.1 peptidoglycan-binding domain-containing protein [Rhodospirillales bacterium]
MTNRPKFVAAALMALVLLTIPMTVFAARPTGLPTGETPPGKPDDLVLRAQKALAKAGFYRGPQDGRMSRAIRAAVRAYQTQARLKVTGRISKALVDGLENNLQVRILLKRLDQVRIENMGAAREALLNHPATRDLVTGTEEEVADPTREKAACLESITVRCLLTESLESAKAVFKPELRDWALGEILVAQARAGLGPEAMDTAGKIRDPRLIIVALRDIAEAQAASGLSEKALAAADIISDPVKRAEALAAIADIQVRRGDLQGAKTTADHLIESINNISEPLAQVSFQAQAAVIFAHAGNGRQAADILNATESFARKKIDAGNLGVALRHIAKAFGETEQLAQALNILSDVRDDSNRTPVLIAAATKQAIAGDAAAALATANTIEAVRFRAVVLGQIALAEARNCDLDAADVTLKLALAAIEKIKLPYARSYAVSRVSLAMAGIGKLPDAGAKSAGLFLKAVNAARKIDDNRLRAHTLWTIAAEQIRAGDDAGAKRTKAYANQATGGIKSTLSQVWMFSDIATGHAAEGEEIAAWAAFDHGLNVARSIDNSWGRARAFGRLAATLIELVDPGNTAAAKSR